MLKSHSKPQCYETNKRFIILKNHMFWEHNAINTQNHHLDSRIMLYYSFSVQRVYILFLQNVLKNLFVVLSTTCCECRVATGFVKHTCNI